MHLPELVKLVVDPKQGSGGGKCAAEVAAAHVGFTNERVWS